MSRDAGSAKESLKKIAALALLTLLYFAAGKLGLALAIVNPSATAVWPPTGIAIAALLILGYRAWPAILAGAFLVNLTTSGSIPASLMIAGGNALEALAGAYLVNRYANGRHVFERARDIFRFIVLAGMASTAISATIGVASLLLNGLALPSNVPHVWLTWWLGDATGALIVAPVLILWANYIRDRDRTRVLEAALLLLSLLVVGVIVFSDLSLSDIRSYPVYLLALPVVVWFAFRVGSPETATAILILSGIAIASTFAGSGPFSGYPANEALLLLQGCMSIVAITFLSLAAVVAERRRTEQELAYSERKYNSVVETARDVVITINERSEILYINAAAVKLFGYRVSEMIGQNLAMLMPERLRSRHQTSFEHYVLTGQKHVAWDGVELLGRHKDGHEIPLEVSFGESSQGNLRLFTGVMRDVTRRKEAEESSRWLATLVESTGDAVVGKTLDGVVLSWNYGAEKIYGYTASEMIGRPISVLTPPDRLDDMSRILESIRSGVEIHRLETERVRKDGQRIFVALTISPIRDATGAIRGASTVSRNITDRIRADQALLRSQSFLTQAQEIGGIGSWVSSLGPDKRLWWSSETYRIFGIEEGTAIDNDTFFAATHPDDRAAIQQAVQQSIAAHKPYTLDHRIRRPDGTERWVTERADVTFDDLGRPVNLAGVVQDITDRKRTEQTIQRLAYVDSLTDLPNRASLLQRLKEAILNAQAKQQTLGLLLINIKDFRDINDTLGHENGDRFLVEVASRLRHALWESDIIARLTGDEFAVLLPRLARRDDIELVVRKMLEALKPVVTIAGIPLEVRPAIGIALYPEHGSDTSTLYQHADVALNASKTKHEAYTIYDPAIDVYDPQRLSLMAELRLAIATDQLQLHYQPRIDFRKRSLVGVEALVRWQHPKRGLIPPDEFIPAAEKTGLIDELTLWVLRTAMFQGKHWEAQGLMLEIAVNISTRSLHEMFLVSSVRELLQQTAFAPERLILEVTESTIMLDPVNAMRELEAVHKLGVQLAIDDFGIGYSSLAYLRQLPVRHLKIDKSFIIDMRDPKNGAIVRGTVELGHSLGLSVTAEGVEDKTNYTSLKLLGCDQAQGYYISRPLPVSAFNDWLSKSRWKAKTARAM
ncbi:EAL domain-containing protein [Sulfuricaulis limicola]|uniref:bifunctional diguanylate cyclase/phosphodiesterase n=1 Tax=Sulfuricaulis limicola TaxID=1620215 RepID=UPI000BBB0012|nr:EAL domain-containing protein [Sulfuricaulis limicola]